MDVRARGYLYPARVEVLAWWVRRCLVESSERCVEEV
jgi:hypothetical protein